MLLKLEKDFLGFISDPRYERSRFKKSANKENDERSDKIGKGSGTSGTRARQGLNKLISLRLELELFNPLTHSVRCI